MTKNVRTTMLEEAIGLINGPRQAHYGTPQENFGATSHMWSAYLGIKVSPGDVVAARASASRLLANQSAMSMLECYFKCCFHSIWCDRTKH